MTNNTIQSDQTQDGKVKIKFLLIPSIIVSVFLSLLLTILVNIFIQ
jgi:hypothetical protein